MLSRFHHGLRRRTRLISDVGSKKATKRISEADGDGDRTGRASQGFITATSLFCASWASIFGQWEEDWGRI